MAEEQKNIIPEDEIDFKSIGSKITNALFYPFTLLLQNIKTTLLFVFAAIALSIAVKYLIPKSYKADFILRPISNNERTHLKMLDDIKRLLKLQDFKSISRELKIDESTAKTLQDLEVVNFAFAKNRADSSNTTIVTMELSDYTQLLPMQNILLNYLESNPYLTKIKEYQKLNIQLKSGLIDKDISLLDSLKLLQLNSYDKLKVTDQNSVYLKDLINPTSTYTLSLERLNQKVGLIGQTMFLDNFQLVKGVVVSERHSWPPRILLICLVIAPLFMVACVVFLHVKKK